jgi:hypothetical protein
MKHPLDDARLKVERAKRHLAEAKAEVACYLDTKPYEFPTEHQGGVFTARPAVIKQQPPDNLRLVLGDVIGNLRPILDYVAWELVVKHSPTPPVKGKTRIYFPLSKDPAQFAERIKEFRDKYAVPAPALSLIESAQPYHPGYQPLGTLNALVNEDKHIVPVLTIGYLENTSIEVTVDGPPLGTCVLHPPGSHAVVIGHNTSVMSVRRLTLDDLTADGQLKLDPFFAEFLAAHQGGRRAPEQQATTVKVDGKVSVFVAIDHPSVQLEPIERTLEPILHCVQGIIATFDAFV